MVTVTSATLREGPFVREIGLSGEHARRFAGPGYAIAFEIANVRRESCRPGPAVTHDARFDDDASGRIEKPSMRRRAAAYAASDPGPDRSRKAALRPRPKYEGLGSETLGLRDLYPSFRAALRTSAKKPL
jgi:hypothetical protein